MKIALIQMQMSMDKKVNFKRAMENIEDVCLNGAELVLFPEAQLTPFFPQYPAAMLEGMGISKTAFSIPEDDDRIKAFSDKAKEKEIYLVPNFYVKTKEGRLFDRSYMMDPQGEILGSSDMVNIYSAENFFEKDYYEPSESGFRVYDTPFGRIGIVICFDRHLAESVRSCALQGAQMVLIPAANVKSEPLDVFEAELRGQAYENNVFIAMCNRVGQEDAMDFAGQSIVIDPEGQIIAKAGDGEENLLLDIDLGAAIRSRNKRPYLGFIRPNAAVYHMAGEFTDPVLPSPNTLYLAMADYDKGDPMRIQHFTKVWTYARLIGLGENLTAEEETILETAAIVHDIGIHKAEKDFGSSDGKLQEKLGPMEAEKLLKSLLYPPRIIERVCFLVGHHHTYDKIEGRDYQILVEADFLVNIYEDKLPKSAAETAYQKIFCTETGKRLFRQMYPKEGWRGDGTNK